MSGRIMSLVGDEQFLSVLSIGLLLLVAGCTAMPFGGPSDQEQPVQLVLNNSANVTNTFDVWEVKLGATLTVYYRDGTVVNATVGQGLSNRDTGPRTITKIDFPDSAQQYGQHTLEPGAEFRRDVENFSTNGALVVVVSRSEGEIFSRVSANCDGQALVGLEVVSRPDPPGGVFAAYGCQ